MNAAMLKNVFVRPDDAVEYVSKDLDKQRGPILAELLEYKCRFC